jgi:purine-binding chemotaxis protein CheW
VIADAVNQVIELNAQDIEEPPAFGTRVRLEYLAGMGKLGKKFALILNIDCVLSAAELLTVAGLPNELADAPKDNAQEPAERPEA